MYPILILRAEVVCLILLIFLYFTSRSYHITQENKCFNRILAFALSHVVFDIVTVLTVNNVDTVPSWLNRFLHILFYLTAILFSNEIVNYVVRICYPTKAKKLYVLGHILTVIYLCCLPLLSIQYVPDLGTYSSSGPAAYVGYGLALTFFLAALVTIFTHFRKMSASIKIALIPMMLVLIVTEISQIVWRSLLFTGGAITIVTFGFFFSLENPVEVFMKKAMTDALTGVRSRSSYEEDIERMNKQFVKKPSDDYVFVFCDINGLRSVNNRLGHAEGDNYITLIASAINRCMKQASAVYRIGGDEFLILYYNVEEEVVNGEIKALQESCKSASEGLAYEAGVAAGYAMSSSGCDSLYEVVKTADYAMYRNKANGNDTASYGTKLNYAGLTDKIFDAMCASNQNTYPFIHNLDTGICRISPDWKTYFGLDSEFFSDFLTVWKDHIHPDYCKGYMEDILAVVNGQRKYHYFHYLAKNAKGDYVPVSCHGSVYRDNSSGTTYFTGYMTNHGLDDHVDPVTGLLNFDVLNSEVSTYMDEKKSFTLIKLSLNNFAHVNMLYGYVEGNEVLKKVAAILQEELGEKGKVFCQNAVDFTLLIDGCNDAFSEGYYRTVCAKCAAGISIKEGTVPIIISGGAITNCGQRAETEKMRGWLLFALEESQYFRRNALVFYHDPKSTNAETDVSLLAKIHADALGEMRYFRLRYQPIVDVKTKKTVGAEALLRWIHPTEGEIPPGKFIAFIENDPCYYRLGLWIFEHAVRDAKEMQKTIPGFRININITAPQLQNDNFADNMFEILRKYDYPPSGVVLELTERCKEMDSAFLAKKIGDLRSRGLLVAFDDLGTGYSTISLLMDIPVDEIKLDRNFVKDLNSQENYRIFVRALVLGCTASANKYTICFEGIENEEMFQTVAAFGDFLVQGYYFAKPLLREEFNAYLEKEE